MGILNKEIINIFTGIMGIVSYGLYWCFLIGIERNYRANAQEPTSILFIKIFLIPFVVAVMYAVKSKDWNYIRGSLATFGSLFIMHFLQFIFRV